MPYFKNSWKSLVAVIVATLIGSATEPAIPALMQQLLDKGFQAGALPLWWVPLALLGLFSLRGAASFVAQYCLSNAANHAMQLLRRHLFAKVLQADLSLFARHNASSISNTVVYEVQNGTHMLVYAMLSVLKDSLTFVALLGYLLYINWKLTLFVLVILPAVAWVMKVLSKRLHQITRARDAGVTRIILGTSYKAEVFREFIDGSDLGIEVVIATEDEPLGTGGAIRIPIDIVIPPDSRAVNHLCSQQGPAGRIVLATGHPDSPEFTIPVCVAVGP